MHRALSEHPPKFELLPGRNIDALKVDDFVLHQRVVYLLRDTLIYGIGPVDTPDFSPDRRSAPDHVQLAAIVHSRPAFMQQLLYGVHAHYSSSSASQPASRAQNSHPRISAGESGSRSMRACVSPDEMMRYSPICIA